METLEAKEFIYYPFEQPTVLNFFQFFKIFPFIKLSLEKNMVQMVCNVHSCRFSYGGKRPVFSEMYAWSLVHMSILLSRQNCPITLHAFNYF